MSTFHRLSSFILRTPAAFTAPSVVMMSMLPLRAWCPRYRSTYSFGRTPWVVVDGFPKLCNELLPSTSRTSHLSRQATSPNPDETDRICCHRQYPLQDGMGLSDLSTCASRANFRVRVCRFTARMADSATPSAACLAVSARRQDTGDELLNALRSRR